MQEPSIDHRIAVDEKQDIFTRLEAIQRFAIGSIEAWGIEFDVIDGSTPDGNKFRAAYGIYGAPNLAVIKKGKFIGNVPGFINNRVKLKIALQKFGVNIDSGMIGESWGVV
jgi:hypothetical protein